MTPVLTPRTGGSGNSTGVLDGPFEGYRDLYGTTSARIRESVEAPRSAAKDLRILAEEFGVDQQRLRQLVEGSLEDPLQRGIKLVAQQSLDLAAAGEYAAAVLDHFADIVASFENKVFALNLMWRTWSRARHLAQPADAKDLRTARDQVEDELRPAYRHARRALEDGADEVADMLHRGPNPRDVRTLLSTRSMSLDDAWLFPGVSLSDEERRVLSEPVDAPESSALKEGFGAFMQAGYESVLPMTIAGHFGWIPKASDLNAQVGVDTESNTYRAAYWSIAIAGPPGAGVGKGAAKAGTEALEHAPQLVTGSAKRLAANLEAAGEVRKLGEHARHIVPHGSPKAREAQDVLRDFGIHIDDAVNGVFLPGTKKAAEAAAEAGGTAAAHLTTHTTAYYKALTKELERAGSRERAIEILQEIKSQLLSGGYP